LKLLSGMPTRRPTVTPFTAHQYRIAHLESQIAMLRKKKNRHIFQRKWQIEVFEKELAQLKAMTPARTRKVRANPNAAALRPREFAREPGRGEAESVGWSVGSTVLIVVTSTAVLGLLGWAGWVLLCRRSRRKRSNDLPRALDPSGRSRTQGG
jgi:hypothetical protein